MFNRIVFGYEGNNPLGVFLDGILYFSERELKVVQLLGNCRSDKEIAELLKIDEKELNEIKSRRNIPAFPINLQPSSFR